MARYGFRGEWISKKRPKNSPGIANIAVDIAQYLHLTLRIFLNGEVIASYRENLPQNFAIHFSEESSNGRKPAKWSVYRKTRPDLS